MFEKIDAYDVRESLGRGTFGTVYIAKRKTDGHVACMKKLAFCPGKPPVGESSFEREVKALGSVQHPNVVKVFGWGREPEQDGEEVGYRPWILLEYCSQGSLKGFIDRAKKAGATRLGVEEEQVVRWVKDVLSALTELHSSGIMHRDLKPANVVVHASGVAKVCDFGVAASSEHTRDTPAGTPLYMAPQIVCGPGDGYKADADMYSVGVMVLEIFTLSRIPDAHGGPTSDISKLLYIWYAGDTDIAEQNERDLQVDVRATLSKRVSRQWSDAVSKLVVGCLRYSRDVRLTSKKAAALLGPCNVGSESGHSDKRLDGGPSDPVCPQETHPPDDGAAPSTSYHSAAMRDAARDAGREASQHCDVCKRWVTKGNWGVHCAGKPHVKRLEAAAAAAAPAADAPPPRARAAAEAEAPKETAPPAAAATTSAAAAAAAPSPSPAPPCTLRLSPGEVSGVEDSGPVVLKKFTGDTVDLFVCGEDVWRLPPELRGGVGAAEEGVVRGVRCAVSMPDEVRWGCKDAPGRVPTLVRDEEGAGAGRVSAPGVVYTVAKAKLAACCATLKSKHRLRLACFEPQVGGGGARTVAVFVREKEGMTADQVASMVAKAHGSEGPNYALLCSVVHEYKRRGWAHEDLERLKKNVERRLGWK